MLNLLDMGKRAREASYALATATTEQKNAALNAIADALQANLASILAANTEDIADARTGGTDEIWIRDRMDLSKRMSGVIADVRKVIDLPDPVGENFEARTLENGLRVSKRRTPVGVLGVIYEA